MLTLPCTYVSPVHSLLVVLWYGTGTFIRCWTFAHPASQCCGSGFIESGSGSRWGSNISSESASGYGSGSGYRSRVLMTKNWRRKKNSWIFFPFLFLIKITIYLSLGLNTGRPSNRRTIQHFKRINLLTVFYFSGPFLPSWTGSGLRIRIRIRIQGPLWIQIQSGSGYGSGSATLLLVDRYFPTSSYQRNSNFKSALLNKTAEA